MIQLQEHELLTEERDARFDNRRLVSWDRPPAAQTWGYYASFVIGAEWVDKEETLVVTAKRGMENIDFLKMFMVCFTSDLALEAFSNIYHIESDERPIDAPSLKGIVSPLIVFHFLGVMRRIKTLKRGYVHHAENLKKIKGRINIQKNEKLNIAPKRYDRIFCEYEEYSVDIPENRLLKKALLFSKRMVKSMGEQQSSFSKINEILSKSLMLFENVSDEVDLKEIKQAKMHKLFSEYSEAIRLAKLILKHFDYSIHNVGESNEKVIPFDLDMSLLYEHYVYGLLHEAYQERIRYQFIGNKAERPDFLYKSDSFRAILDTKYKPKLINYSLDIEDIRQLSGYGRDLRVLRWLGYDDITETSSTPSVPCIIIYPIDSNETSNPFKNKKLEELCSNIVKGISQFYLISVPIPIMQRQIYST